MISDKRLEEVLISKVMKHSEALELAKDTLELRNQSTQIKEFFQWVIHIAFEGGSLDGGEIQDKALELGLLEEIVYCSELHSELVSDEACFEDGDIIYFIKKEYR